MAQYTQQRTQSGSTSSGMKRGTQESLREAIEEVWQRQENSSETGRTLDTALAGEILGGLQGMMTDEQIMQFAENLMRPQLNAQMENSRQAAEATELAKRQEIENLAAELARSVAGQQGAYRKSMSDIERAALSRGMGRSSYTLSLLAGQGNALAEAVRQLTEESNRKQEQAQAQITQAKLNDAQTQGRLQADYAANLAAKAQELREQQRQEYNRNYMTAISSALGERTLGSAQGMGTTTGFSTERTNEAETSSSSETAQRVIDTILDYMPIGMQETQNTAETAQRGSGTEQKTQKKPQTPARTGGGSAGGNMMMTK